MDLSRLHPRFINDFQPCPITGCWNWSGHPRDGGYSGFYITHRGALTRYAHRYAYEALVGPIPDGMVIDHLCRNRQCVNPAHLEPVTHKTNLMRGHGTLARINAQKTHCNYGHELSGENLRLEHRAAGGVARICRECKRRVDRNIKAHKRLKAAA